jgi:predicted RNA methylase
MMNDHNRNAFYRDALKAAVKPTDMVLEIGTGSGLLAMLSARAGADHVYAIEANKNLADLAAHIMGENGMADNITIINKLSTHVEAEIDLPKKANVLVSEILGTLLLGESALTYVPPSFARPRVCVCVWGGGGGGIWR